jgi:hypothetical protein
MIQRGLALLIALQIKAWFRRTFRGLRRPQNLIILVIGLGTCVGWVLMLMHPGTAGARDPTGCACWLPRAWRCSPC